MGGAGIHRADAPHHRAHLARGLVGEVILPHFNLIVDMQMPLQSVAKIACQHLKVQMGIMDFMILRIDLLQDGIVDAPNGKMPGMKKYLVTYENNSLPN